MELVGNPVDGNCLDPGIAYDYFIQAFSCRITFMRRLNITPQACPNLGDLVQYGKGNLY